jgi:hypothetical protein
MHYCCRRHERHPLSREHLGRWFAQTLGAEPARRRNQPVGEHVVEAEQSRRFQGQSITHHGRIAELITGTAYGYDLGSLEEARAAFCAATKLNPRWPEGEEKP